MGVSESVIRTIAGKYYTTYGRSEQGTIPRDEVVIDINEYFDSGKRSADSRLHAIIIEFDREDNILLNPEPEKVPGLGGWLWDNIHAFFTEMFPSVWEGFTDIISDAIDKNAAEWVQKFTRLDDPLYKKFLDKLVKLGFIDANVADQLRIVAEEAGGANPIMYIVLIGGFLFTWIQIISGTVGGDYIKKQNAIYTPGVPAAESLISGLRIAPELRDRFIKAFKENGLSDEDIELMLISAYSLYDVDTTRQLFLRGDITYDVMLERLGEMGFTPQRIADIVKLWEVIPGVQDILFMVGKEAFEPEEVKKMGLDAEFPHDVAPWLAKQGLNNFWQQKYWAAHWEMPSLRQGFEMFHRRVIDADMLNSLFKTVEIPPFWREKLIEIAYNPYTRVDIRRMHAMGTVTTQEVYDNYLDLGYSAGHAEKMTQWTLDYNSRENRTISREQIERSYRDEVITRSDARAWLISIGLNEEAADFTLLNIDYQEEQSRQDNIVEVIKESYTSNLMERDEAVSRLHELNLTASKIDYLIQRWTVRKISNRKLPSKTDLKKLFTNGIITIDQYTNQLRIIGYEEKYVEWFTKLQTLEGELNIE